MNPYLISALVFGILCVFFAELAKLSAKKKSIEEARLSHLFSAEAEARNAGTMGELNAVIDRILLVDYPRSRKIELKLVEINAYIRGRKDGRP